ncbi:hypothetical protein IWQ60_001473 [Tieghemiomyces parasiticus]|uniref:Uncharacterized protein n=1 Tax=Tieghemiomyces parasiticus TaxID=78921 RepID=A0A9W8DWK6_9FUNG|nr:hypothetical protein IWQ60_001473 [Tieghemiomyces parasiticus]
MPGSSACLVLRVEATSLFSKDRKVVDDRTGELLYTKTGPAAKDSRTLFCNVWCGQTSLAEALQRAIQEAKPVPAREAIPHAPLRSCTAPVLPTTSRRGRRDPTGYATPSMEGGDDPLDVFDRWDSTSGRHQSRHGTEPPAPGMDRPRAQTLDVVPTATLPRPYRMGRKFLDNDDYLGCYDSPSLEVNDDDTNPFANPGPCPEYYGQFSPKRRYPYTPQHAFYMPHEGLPTSTATVGRSGAYQLPPSPPPSHLPSPVLASNRRATVTTHTPGPVGRTYSEPLLARSTAPLVLWDVTTRRWRQQNRLSFINPNDSVVSWVQVARDNWTSVNRTLYRFVWPAQDSHTRARGVVNSGMRPLPALPAATTSQRRFLDPSPPPSPATTAAFPSSSSSSSSRGSSTSPAPFQLSSSPTPHVTVTSARSPLSSVPTPNGDGSGGPGSSGSGEIAFEGQGSAVTGSAYFWTYEQKGKLLTCYHADHNIPIAHYRPKRMALTSGGKFMIHTRYLPSAEFMEFLVFSCLVILDLGEKD